MSDDARWLGWLAEGQRNSSILISQFCIIKASGFVRRTFDSRSADSEGLMDRFCRSRISLHSVVDALTVSPELYNQYSSKANSESLELFDLCLAQQNSYIYLCFSSEDVERTKALVPTIGTKTLEEHLIEVQSPES